MSRNRMTQREPGLRVKFRNWLIDLSDEQVAALEENWDNVMNDAALERIDAWVTAGIMIAELREGRRPE